MYSTYKKFASKNGDYYVKNMDTGAIEFFGSSEECDKWIEEHDQEFFDQYEDDYLDWEDA